MSKAPRRAVEATKRRDFLERLTRILGMRPGEVEGLLSGDRRSAVRLNPLRGEVDVAELRAEGYDLDPIEWCPGAYGIDEADRRRLAASPWFQEGRVYIQNPSSFVPPLALDPQRGDAILDVGAAPGGKSSHIAALVGNDAELWLNDPLPARVRKLEEVTSLLGVRYARITRFEGQHLDKFLDRTFDRILLDAQCSGEGQFDLRRPDALEHWSRGRVEKYRRLQQRMLVASFKLLEPGGTLVYSTCTFGPEENELPLDHLLRHFPAEVVPIELDVPGRRPGLRSWDGHQLHPSLEDAVRIVPSEQMEGFFVCKLRRSG